MRRSSAYKVQYEVRPSKQTERRILLDLLKASAEVGFPLATYKYLGFGGVRFYDFEMIFRHLGIRDMTSLELDETLFARCRYNKPFGFIEFRNGLLSDYIGSKTFKKPLIAWLDYDSFMSDGIVRDLRLLAAKMPVGSFVFATVDARMPPGWHSLSGVDRLAVVNEEYGEFALATSAQELTLENFPDFSERVLWASLSEALSRRQDGEFVPLMRVFYKDTALMMTVGACLCTHAHAPAFKRRLKADFAFLAPKDNAPAYSIPSFNLTTKERQLLDMAVTRGKGAPSLSKSLRRLGFSKSELTEYKRIFRFVPKYVESYL